MSKPYKSIKAEFYDGCKHKQNITISFSNNYGTDVKWINKDEAKKLIEDLALVLKNIKAK
jgi:hypothetical protein